MRKKELRTIAAFHTTAAAMAAERLCRREGLEVAGVYLLSV